MFPAGAQSVGFDVFDQEGILEIIARVYSGETLLDTITVRGSGKGTRFFLGVASDDPITRVSLAQSDQGLFTVDNVTFNSVSSVCPCHGLTAGDVTWDSAFPATGGEMPPPGDALIYVQFSSESYTAWLQTNAGDNPAGVFYCSVHVLTPDGLIQCDPSCVREIDEVHYNACNLELQEIFDSIP